MTQSEIKTKFLIEYDKDNVTSSYPSLTDKEIANILNKAYLALIAQKVTGNNARNSYFEADVKAISDIQPLICTKVVPKDITSDSRFKNGVVYPIPTDPTFLYYVSSAVKIDNNNMIVTLINHENANKFKETTVNKPWIKGCVCYIEDNKIILLHDSYVSNNKLEELIITYIMEPEWFSEDFLVTSIFQLNDSMAEELVSLAVVMALENVESQRTQTKAQMRGLEA